MEKLHNNYQYLSLDTTNDEIRLLELLPRHPDSSGPVQARLIHRSLKQPPKYDALSYVWGSAEDQTKIKLDNMDFTVTSNLGRALRDLSDYQSGQDEVLVIWADAVCINQRDYEERNAQVKMMWKIYAGAEKVRTWLDVVIPDSVSQALLNFETNIKSSGDVGGGPEFWKPIATMLEHPYWNRVWVQQEIAYAKDLLIHCHNMLLPRSLLIRFFTLLQSYYNQHEESMGRNEAWQWNMFLFQPSLFRDDISSKVKNHHRYKNIYDAIHSTGRLRATDIRDRIYGLLSLVEGDSDHIKISYELPAPELYCQVAQFLIQRHHSLIFLNLAGLNISPEHFDLPTWLPYPRGHENGLLGSDTDIGPSVFSWHQTLLASISHNTAILPFIAADHKILHVHGMRISEIEIVCQSMIWQGVHTSEFFLPAWNKFFDHWIAKNSKEHGLVSKLDAIKSFVCLAFICRTSERATYFETNYLPEFEKFFAGAVEESKEDLTLPGSMSKDYNINWKIICEMIAVTSLNRYLTLTKNGVMGLAPITVMPGDEVWMLFRHPLPMVLRREGDHFLVVGQAFIDFAIQEEWDKAMAGYKEGDRTCHGCEIECISLK